MAMELQQIEGSLGEYLTDGVVIGIDEQAHAVNPHWHRSTKPGGFSCRDGAWARRIKNKAEIGGTARDRLCHRRLGRQTANLRGNGHLASAGLVSVGGAVVGEGGVVAFGKEMSTRPSGSGCFAALISASRCCR